jgi:hypothetical protein
MLRSKGVTTETAKKSKIYLIENNGFIPLRRKGGGSERITTVKAGMLLKTKETSRVECLVPQNVTEKQDVTRGSPEC